jgi:hypothetical protein
MTVALRAGVGGKRGLNVRYCLQSSVPVWRGRSGLLATVLAEVSEVSVLLAVRSAPAMPPLA